VVNQTKTVSAAIAEKESSSRYEAPQLVALGNLHDLLAGQGGTVLADQCNGDTTGGLAPPFPPCPGM
jgi:hypothetical protein